LVIHLSSCFKLDSWSNQWENRDDENTDL
jgi:hypothetical protein